MAKIASITPYRGIHSRIEFCDIKPDDIRFRNFSGAEKKFNPAGNRNFKLVIDDPADVDKLREVGVYVSERESSRMGAPSTFQIKVNVSYRFDEPYIILTSGSAMTKLDQNSVCALDNVEICDIPHLVVVTASNNYNDSKIAFVEELGVVKRTNDFREACEAQLNSRAMTGDGDILPRVINADDFTDDEAPF